jgi:hypothetical protein
VLAICLCLWMLAGRSGRGSRLQAGEWPECVRNGRPIPTRVRWHGRHKPDMISGQARRSGAQGVAGFALVSGESGALQFRAAVGFPLLSPGGRSWGVEKSSPAGWSSD